MGTARLQKNTHTITHYYNLKPIIEELQDLETQHNFLQDVIANKSSFKRDLENYNKIISHLQTSIEEKLTNIIPERERSKRALFNGIGSVIKSITGNLDSTDGEHFDKILNDLTTNSNNFQKQLNLQYTFNKESVKRFDETIKNIEHNELLLKSRIMQLTNIVERELEIPNILYAKDLCNQLILLYNTILSVLQDIENSITFCRIGTYHPSILKHKELVSILTLINEKFQIPLDPKNISDLQKLMTVNCKVEDKKIVYFLSFPINYDTIFDLYFLLSIPSLNDNGFSTIIPHSKYFLKSHSSVKPLNNACILSNPFQCFQKDLDNNLNNCESEILLHENANNCEQTRLDISENHIQLIPEINQYLAVFPIQETLKFESSHGVEIKEIKGIYLIELDRDNLVFRNEKINFKLESFGKPTILNNVNLDISKMKNLSNTKIKLNNLKINDINLNQLMPESNVSSSPIENSSQWQILNCITLVLTLSIILYILLNKIRFIPCLRNIPTSNQTLSHSHSIDQNLAPIQHNHNVQSKNFSSGQTDHNVTLPGGAKF